MKKKKQKVKVPGIKKAVKGMTSAKKHLAIDPGPAINTLVLDNSARAQAPAVKKGKVQNAKNKTFESKSNKNGGGSRPDEKKPKSAPGPRPKVEPTPKPEPEFGDHGPSVAGQPRRVIWPWERRD